MMDEGFDIRMGPIPTSTLSSSGYDTPATADTKLEIDHHAHFQRLNTALRLTPSPEDFAIPSEGRIENFGVVMGGVYRSAFPTENSFSFLEKLKLKTVLYVHSTELDLAPWFQNR
jgi:hypothetical protein